MPPGAELLLLAAKRLFAIAASLLWIAIPARAPAFSIPAPVWQCLSLTVSGLQPDVPAYVADQYFSQPFGHNRLILDSFMLSRPYSPYVLYVSRKHLLCLFSCL